MKIIAYPPYDALLGEKELNLELKGVTLWDLLQALAAKYPAFAQELPEESTDEALRSRLLPLGPGRVYSVADVLGNNDIVKLFPPVSGG
ncbi:MAG: MoaD/ThiS family protein [Firmicutes bacterium]|jgi:molybdopterin converting factor small subunit|nr:MoaD/ThiS family protein [Bacillota bacterium]